MPTPRVGLSVEFDRGYHGRDSREVPEKKPELTRVFSALMAAGGRLGMSEDVVDAALGWVESNPPKHLTVPEFDPYVDGKGYDHTVSHFMSPGRLSDKGSLNPIEAPYMWGSIPRGAIVWSWDDVPAEVSEALRAMCAGISYIGTSDSLCRVTFGDAPEPTHTLLTDGYHGSALNEEVPSEGRAEELRARWAGTAPDKGRVPRSMSRNMVKATGDVVRHARDKRQRITSLPYVPVNTDLCGSDDAPWNRGVWIPFRKGDTLDPLNHVRVAETVHRALVRLSTELEGYCPEILSGKYANGRPDGVVNNVAVAIVPQRVGAVHAGGDRAGILVLVPAGADPSDAAVVVDSALAFSENKRSNLSRMGIATDPEGIREVNPAQWWAPPRNGTRRTWSPYPFAVMDIAGATPFVAAHRAVKFVAGKGVPKKIVEKVRAISPSQLASYTHRTATVRGTDGKGSSYRAQIVHPAFDAKYNLSDVFPPTAVVAVGQSRHFGVGLLVPIDEEG